ncbi:flagellar hook-associated protein FlgK [Fuerstiella marisgermanici]|uniref:Flagellar hook-associated protein 1 n=1 Tax=Fuerstiella marisgermanici TaxID=1891926 RepID=A0A1P8WA57_9PLAN|nr:flagellar hook-associated protein FlgK [Fuerstiella marisgermanici]APZ90931.1 Flagellar hook-associated protein 1 [Fuerstiella marisgermanici]
MRGYEIGLSALRTHSTTLNVIGNNIANAATPGFHRERVDLATRAPQLDGQHLIGTGVEIAGIRRVVDEATDAAILRNQSLLGASSADLSIAGDIESLFTPGDSSIHEYFSNFFNKLESVANSPEVPTVRGEFLASAENLLFQFDNIRSALQTQSGARLSELRDSVEQINSSIAEVAELNKEIRFAETHDRNPNSLLDRRDQILNELAELTDVSIRKDLNGKDIVTIGGSFGAIGEIPSTIEVVRVGDRWDLQMSGSGHPLQLAGGKVGGLLNAVNNAIPDTLDRLEQLAQTIVSSVDQQHAKGLKDNGAHDTLRASRRVESINTPLAYSGIAFPVERGNVTITVTDPTTGHRSSHAIDVDPYTESLADVTAKFDAIAGVTAVLNSDNGRLTLAGEGSKQIDFAGRVDNVPDLTSWAGSSVPQFTGSYEGPNLDTWDISFNQSGTVGVTDGLEATIRNSNGQVVATVNVGTDYEANTPMAIADGVFLQFGSGTINATDVADVVVTPDSDTTGLLAALGINSLFSGASIGTYALRSDIAADSTLLSTSTTGFPGDASNVAAMANLRDLRFGVLDDQTFVEELADFTADVGMDAAQAASQKEQLEAYGQRLEETQNSVSGVSTDEEFLKMLEVERAFQAAARFINTVEATYDEIMQIIR